MDFDESFKPKNDPLCKHCNRQQIRYGYFWMCQTCGVQEVSDKNPPTMVPMRIFGFVDKN